MIWRRIAAGAVLATYVGILVESSFDRPRYWRAPLSGAAALAGYIAVQWAGELSRADRGRHAAATVGRATKDTTDLMLDVEP